MFGEHEFWTTARGRLLDACQIQALGAAGSRGSPSRVHVSSSLKAFSQNLGEDIAGRLQTGEAVMIKKQRGEALLSRSAVGVVSLLSNWSGKSLSARFAMQI
ncbi:MAG: hypothetical protein CM1200mP18_09060 [Gammaproteobacteria bacterium]|nr:MAG: hypothetical protein CM1200mP18_09060 [Gammaproteobacteria bacterium]